MRLVDVGGISFESLLGVLFGGEWQPWLLYIVFGTVVLLLFEDVVFLFVG